MKICPKCGHKNSKDSQFCEKCGMDLKNITPSKSHKTIIVVLAIIIVILVAVILFLVGSRSDSAKQSTTKDQQVTSIKKHRPSQTSQQSQSVSESGPKLHAADLDNNTRVAAVIYYAYNKGLEGWESPSLYQQHGVNASHLDEDTKYYKQGNDPIMVTVQDLGKGGGEFFTTDGDNVYFYHMQGAPGEDESMDDVIEKNSNPQTNATWAQITDFINQNGGYDQVQAIAQKVTLS